MNVDSWLRHCDLDDLRQAVERTSNRSRIVIVTTAWKDFRQSRRTDLKEARRSAHVQHSSDVGSSRHLKRRTVGRRCGLRLVHGLDGRLQRQNVLDQTCSPCIDETDWRTLAIVCSAPLYRSHFFAVSSAYSSLLHFERVRILTVLCSCQDSCVHCSLMYFYGPATESLSFCLSVCLSVSIYLSVSVPECVYENSNSKVVEDSAKVSKSESCCFGSSDINPFAVVNTQGCQ